MKKKLLAISGGVFAVLALLLELFGWDILEFFVLEIKRDLAPKSLNYYQYHSSDECLEEIYVSGWDNVARRITWTLYFDATGYSEKEKQNVMMAFGRSYGSAYMPSLVQYSVEAHPDNPDILQMRIKTVHLYNTEVRKKIIEDMIGITVIGISDDPNPAMEMTALRSAFKNAGMIASPPLTAEKILEIMHSAVISEGNPETKQGIHPPDSESRHEKDTTVDYTEQPEALDDSIVTPDDTNNTSNKIAPSRIILIILFALAFQAALWVPYIKIQRKKEKKRRAENAESDTPPYIPKEETEPSKEETILRRESIQDAIELLYNKYGVPYPFLHFINDNDDCLYFRTLDSLEAAKKGRFDSLHRCGEAIIDAIFQHLKLPNEKVNLCIEQIKGDSYKSGEVGVYKNSGPCCGEIIFRFHQSMGADEVIAIIAHMCMFHVLQQRDVAFSETDKNKILIDVAVLFFGIGGNMSISYQKKTGVSYHSVPKADGTEVQRVITTSKLGYLNSEEIEEASKICIDMRQKWIRQKAIILKEEEAHLEKSIILNRALFQESLNASSEAARLRTEEYAILSDNARDIQSDFEGKVGWPDITLLTIESDYRVLYKSFAGEFDARIQKYELYNTVLSKRLGYIG